VSRLGNIALGAPRPLRGQCEKEAIKKKDGFERGVEIREYGPGGATATERPMRKGSCKETGWV
jgi:hypothetical protein